MDEKKTFSFEQALTRLEALVEEMEAGEAKLDATLQAYEEGMALVKQCRHTLEQAELRVEKVMQQHTDGTVTTTPFEGA